MNPERTVKITKRQENGELAQVEVRMLYCAATETGYQALSGKNIEVFLPVIGKDKDGKSFIKEMPPATDEDYINLALAAIIAAYERDKQTPPIDSSDIIYTATRAEVVELVSTIAQMRNEWVYIPNTVEKEINESKAKRKGTRKNV